MDGDKDPRSLRVIRQIAFIRCNFLPTKHKISNPPCIPCYRSVEKSIAEEEYIDAELIETVAICIANIDGNYVVGRLTPLELKFAFRLLVDIVPYIKEKIEEISKD